MVRSNGGKLLQCCFSRSQSSSSILLEGSANVLYKTLYQCGKRSFSSGLGPIRGVSGCFDFINVHHKKWLLLGHLNNYWNITRSIHSSAHMNSRDFYEVLGVDNNARVSEIKNAYLAIAKKVHPDTNKEDPDAHIKFQEAQKAYEVLKDEEKRSVYDQVGHEAYEHPLTGMDSPGFDPEMDDSLFGPNGGGADAQVSVELSFMEAIQGCVKTVTFQTALACGTCDGTGVPPGTKPETCKGCKGSGKVSKETGPLYYTCRQCDGTGKFVKDLCKSCRGLRVVKGSKSVKLDIMAGIDDNEILKVNSSGGEDPRDNQPGDLYVTVKVREDPVFRRKGADIHVDAVLNRSQLVSGATIKVPTLTGDAVVKVRAGTKAGQKVVLKKKGIKSRNSMSFGDQYVHFNVRDPVNTTRKQQEPNEEFSKDEQRGEYEKRAAAGASG